MNIAINDANKESFLFILNWIKNGLEDAYQELKNGFVNIMCFEKYQEYTNIIPSIIKNIGKEFENIYGEKFYPDMEWNGMEWKKV